MLWNLCLSYRWVSTSFKRSWALEAGDKPFLSLHPSIHPNPCAVSYWECRQDSESDLRSTLSGGMGWLSRSWVQILALDTGWQQQMGYLVSWTIFEAIGTRWLCSLRRWSPLLISLSQETFSLPPGGVLLASRLSSQQVESCVNPVPLFPGQRGPSLLGLCLLTSLAWVLGNDILMASQAWREGRFLIL